MRFPFTVTEEILAFGNRLDQPQNACIEIRVSGSIDVSKLTNAVAAAVATHPMARARRAAGRRVLRPPMWELRAPAQIDPGKVIQVTDADNDEHLSALRAAFTSQLIDLCEPPAIRLLLVRRPGGDSLLYAWNHAMADGMGGIRFFRSVVRHYEGAADPVPDVDPLAARELRFDPEEDQAANADPSAPVTRWNDLPTLVCPLRPTVEPGYGMCYASRDVDAFDLRLLHEHRSTITVNDVLVAALHLAIAEWNQRQHESAERVMVLMPVNLRPAAWLHEVVANVVGHGVVQTTAEQRVNPTVLMDVVCDQTQLLRKYSAAAFRGRPSWLRRLDPFFILLLSQPRIRRRRQVAALMSNVGRLRGFDSLGTAGSIVELWGSTPASMPPGLGIGVVRFRNRMCLSLRYRHVLFDDDAARSFLGLFMDQIDVVCGDGNSQDARRNALPESPGETPARSDE